MARAIRVLHLEDSPRDAELVRHRLDGDGLACSILVTGSKDSFEAALTREPFDLIISDYNLPGYDGVMALQEALATQPDVPVILISGTLVEEDAVRCLHIGATDYLLKDRLERLAPAVRRALEEAETRRTHRRAEAALGESEARKAAILYSVLDCIVTMDADGMVIEFNAAAERTFGHTKAEAIGRPLAGLIIPPRLRHAHAVGLAHYLATGDGPLIGKLIEITAVRSDGSEIPMELTITAIRSGTVPIFTGVLRDITARKQADETREQQIAERQQAESALRQERDRAQRYLDTAEVILLALDPDGRVELVNRYACAVLGSTAEELLGRNFIATCVPARARDKAGQLLDNLLRGDLSPVECPILAKSGEERLFEWRNTVLRDDAARVIGTFSSGADITERRLLEAQYQQAQKMEAMDDWPAAWRTTSTIS